jgi:hypothetical protein
LKVRCRTAGRIAHLSLSCSPRRLPDPSFLPLARRISRCSACWIACILRLSTSYPPRHSLHCLILSVVDGFPATELAVAPVTFTRRRLAHHTTRRITRFFPLSMACPSRRSLRRLFLSLLDVMSTAPPTGSLLSSVRTSHCTQRASSDRLFPWFVNVLPTAPLAASHFSFPCRRLARRADHSTTSSPPRRSLHRVFLLLVDVVPAAPLAASLVSFSC